MTPESRAKVGPASGSRRGAGLRREGRRCRAIPERETEARAPDGSAATPPPIRNGRRRRGGSIPPRSARTRGRRRAMRLARCAGRRRLPDRRGGRRRRRPAARTTTASGWAAGAFRPWGPPHRPAPGGDRCSRRRLASRRARAATARPRPELRPHGGEQGLDGKRRPERLRPRGPRQPVRRSPVPLERAKHSSGGALDGDGVRGRQSRLSAGAPGARWMEGGASHRIPRERGPRRPALRRGGGGAAARGGFPR